MGITIETLSVKRLREVVDGKSFVEFAEIEYKVSGKRQPGTETTHPDVVYWIRRTDGHHEFMYERLKDPSTQPNGYYIGKTKVGGAYDKTLDFSDIRVYICEVMTCKFN